MNQPPQIPRSTRHLVAPELLSALDAFPSFDIDLGMIAELRAGGIRRDGLMPLPLSPAQQAVHCEQRFVPGPTAAPGVRVLIYRPPGSAADARPAYLHMHGGGYVLGTAELNDGSNRQLAHDLGCIVASVDYRLAPETPFPGAVEDCYAVLEWLHREARPIGVDATRIAIGGESAGGGHAAALALLNRKRGEFPICFQLLDAPMLDDRTGSNPDPHPYCGEFIWTPAKNRMGWQALLGREPGGPDVPAEAVPARAVDLAGLPPTFIAVGALDLFLEESVEYARRLIRAGVPTELHVIPGAFHGFGIGGDRAPQVETHNRLRCDALARAFLK
jgi:acetyl esterase/lipase